MFYDKLLALCGQQNKKITPVVKELGLSTGGIANWRNGAEPDTKTLRLFCDYFNVPATYFLDDEKKPPVETEGEYDEDEDFKAFSKVLGDLTPEELQKVLSYAEFVLKQRNP